MLSLKLSKLLNQFCVHVLAYEKVVSALLFSHVIWLHTLTRMHSVLVLNIAKRAGKKGAQLTKDKLQHSRHINLLTLWT